MPHLPRKVASQLTLLFMVIFLLALATSMALIYRRTSNTLRFNYERDSIARFEQSDYNIGMLLETMDLMSRRLVVDAELNNLFNYNRLSDVERVTECREALKQFNRIISNYPYVCSIVYYTTEGLAIKASPRADTVSFGEEVLTDWFFTSALFEKAQQSLLELHCIGGSSASDFGFTVDTETNPSGRYVSAIRNAWARTAMGTLIVNISMEHFYSVFNASNDGTEAHSCIMDENGLIIASADAGEIGQQGDFVLPADVQWQRLRQNTEAGPVEAVYYRAQAPVGVLARKVPESVITRDISQLGLLIVLLFLGSLAVAYPLQRACVRQIVRPIGDLTTGFRGLTNGRLGIQIPERPLHNELDDLAVRFNSTSRAIEQNFQKTLRHSEEKRFLEMQALRAQINPHFIYNTLNIIKWMAVIERKNNIADCITVFSRFLQATLKEKDPLCTLETEMNLLADYVRILNYRFSGSLVLESDIPDDCAQLQVLRFLLQPLTENAVMHGLAEKVGGVIRVSARREDNALLIRVEDNGVGFAPDKLAEVQAKLASPRIEAMEHIGLANVARRVRLQFGDEYCISAANREEGGARILLRLAIVEKKDVL